MSFYPPNIEKTRLVDLMMACGEKHLRQRGFVRVTVPRIVPASGACENVDTLFEITVGGDPRWFHGGHKRAYFTQTGQLYLETLLGEKGFEKVYCIGPSARAEATIDHRHLTEFEMIEIEFRGTFDQLLEEIELFIGGLIKEVLSIPQEEKAAYGLPTDLAHLVDHPQTFLRLNYQEAIKELDLAWGSDISSAQEQELIANHGKGPIFITRYPNPMSERMEILLAHKVPDLAIKFFNMQPDPNDPEYVLSADCIVPYGGECVGSAARVWELEVFKNRLFSSAMFKRLQEKDRFAEEGFAWYLEMLEKFPLTPHAGCGFGMSRIFQYILTEKDITKVVTFPSNRARLY
mgnify:CR=1 FL=1